jgi:hypothetical protein
MLGHTYRFQVQNGTGVSVTCTVKDRRFKFASDGSLTFASETTPINAVSVATGAFSNSTSIDNSTDKNIGTNITVTFAPASSATGTCSLFLQRSTDGGTTWPSDGQGIFLAGVTFAASATSVARNSQVR